MDIIRAQMERFPLNLYATDSHAAADMPHWQKKFYLLK